MQVSAAAARTALRLVRAHWWIKLLFALPYRHPFGVSFCPAFVRRQYAVQQQTYDEAGHALVTFQPTHARTCPDTKPAVNSINAGRQRHRRLHIVFFHGGGYILPSFRVHWRWVADCVDALGCRASMVQYPLAPENDCRITTAAARRAYEAAVQLHPDDDFVLMGDSAGAGLCMVLNQLLHSSRHPKLPVANVLLSPWLELSNRLEQMRASPTGENRLYGRMAHRAAQSYARDTPLHAPIVSPLHGDLSALAPSLVVYGSQDIVAQDCQRMQTMLETLPQHERPEVDFIPFADMGHVWFFLPTAEREQCLQSVCAYLHSIVG